MDEELPCGPLDTMWKFDCDPAARGLYPAVADPVASTSIVPEGVHMKGRPFDDPAVCRKTIRRFP
ncbi:MAG: two-sector ATPase alpha/beta subunit domain protein [Paenibacillus sp.]|nr:two-sector ATPase alpha/beta subunit domain protein [Paenibacillus sp.]